METEYQIVPIFPIPLYVNKVPDQLIQDHISLFDQEEMVNVNNNEYGSHSKNSYLFHKNEYLNLSNYIFQHTTYYAEEILKYDYTNYKFSQSWISIKKPNDQHKPHIHPYSLISGVLFYDIYQEDSSAISFHREDEHSKTFQFNKIKPKNALNEFVFTVFNINIISNLLILFPSYLKHSVSKNITDIPRKSLAFNVIPRDGFGTEEDLCELKFN